MPICYYKNIKTKIIYFLHGMKFFAIFQSFREGGFIRSFFLGARRTNPEGLPFFINPSVLRPPLLYFALQNTP